MMKAPSSIKNKEKKLTLKKIRKMTCKGEKNWPHRGITSWTHCAQCVKPGKKMMAPWLCHEVEGKRFVEAQRK